MEVGHSYLKNKVGIAELRLIEVTYLTLEIKIGMQNYLIQKYYTCSSDYIKLCAAHNINT